MKTIVQLILNATAAGKSMLLAVDAAAQKVLLGLTKSDVGLGNVDNTSDASKPVSTAQAAAIAAKIGGSVGSTGNRLVRSGTGTLTVQPTGITVDDSDNVSGVGTLACGAIAASGGITSTSGTSSFANGQLTAIPTRVQVLTELLLANRVRFKAAQASGVLQLHNAAEDGFDRLQFGGITAAFCAWKRAGTTLAARLADDSADAPLTAGAITASDAIKTGVKLFSALPAASASTDCIFTVTDRSGRPLAKSDGTNWYNVFTGAILT